MASSEQLLSPSKTITFADVAHQTLSFDSAEPTSKLLLELIDTPWVQRLRNVRQTGNTHLVYMFAEHSRFGHSLGVAYLTNLLMERLGALTPELVQPYKNAVAVAALLHDVGHVAPGSHLGEKLWANGADCSHEEVSTRIIREDELLRNKLEKISHDLPELVCRILEKDPELPPWTVSVISGSGWNADRGNWAIVDSAMCSVSYGRYNVTALIDAFRLSSDGELVIQESRLDALTHFFVARDSMYRQVYQHRVLQSVDALTINVAKRLRDIILEIQSDGAARIEQISSELSRRNIFCDKTMVQVSTSPSYAQELPLTSIFQMTESWWRYHVEQWCRADDQILQDLSLRLRDRVLLKTIRLDKRKVDSEHTELVSDFEGELVEHARRHAQELGYDPNYYVTLIKNSLGHRESKEEPPRVLLDNGEIVPVTFVEPIIKNILQGSASTRTWLAVPKRVKDLLGRVR